VGPEVSFASRLDADQGAQTETARAVRLGDRVRVDRRRFVPGDDALLKPLAVKSRRLLVRGPAFIADRLRHMCELVR